MKSIRMMIISFALLICLSGCGTKSIQKDGFPDDSMLEYTAIIQDKSSACLISGVYNDAIMCWIRHCPLVVETEEDISNYWDYKLYICDCKQEDIIHGDSDFYIPSSARIYVIFINEKKNIVQFGDAAYKLGKSVTETQFYEGIQLCIDGTIPENRIIN